MPDPPETENGEGARRAKQSEEIQEQADDFMDEPLERDISDEQFDKTE